MAITTSSRVSVIDQSSEYRNMKGTVKAVLSGSAFDVRLDGHSCGKPVRLLESQLAETALTAEYDYANC